MKCSMLPGLSAVLNKAALGVAVAALACSQVQATIIFDPFNDAGRTNGADPFDAQWWESNSAINSSVTNGANSVVPGNHSMFIQPGSTFRAMVAHFPLMTLGAIGSGTEGIRMSFDFRLPGTIPNGTGVFRYQLGNSLGSPYTADGVTTPSGGFNDQGFVVRMATGTSTTGLEIGRDAPPPATSGILGMDTVLGTGSPSFSINNTNVHSAEMTIIRDSPTTLKLTAAVYTGAGLSGTQLGSVTVTSHVPLNSDYFKFDLVAIGVGGTSVNHSFDNVLVELIPEPASLALAGLAGLMLLARPRTSRSSSTNPQTHA